MNQNSLVAFCKAVMVLLLLLSASLSVRDVVAAPLAETQYCVEQANQGYCQAASTNGSKGYIVPLFWAYWQAHGGYDTFGYPISAQQTLTDPVDKQKYQMQFFELAALEYHPEATDPAAIVQRMKLGQYNYFKQYPNGVPPSQQHKDPEGSQIDHNGFSIGGRFLRQWLDQAPLNSANVAIAAAKNGWPISDEFEELDGNGTPYTVQYFQYIKLGGSQPEASCDAPPVCVYNLPLGAPVLKSVCPGCVRFFFPDDIYVSDPFLEAWQGTRTYEESIALNGFPLGNATYEPSPEDGRVYMTQWFERARFELHPEYAGSRYEVQLSRLAAYEVAGRTDAPFQEVQNVNNTLIWYPQTEHTVGNTAPGGLAIAQAWSGNGAIKQFGYPLSQPFMEKTKETTGDVAGKSFLVQYFERARLEYHPEHAGTKAEILLGRVGAEAHEPQKILPRGSNSTWGFRFP